jgi:hypothetical protein
MLASGRRLAPPWPARQFDPSWLLRLDLFLISRKSVLFDVSDSLPAKGNISSTGGSRIHRPTSSSYPGLPHAGVMSVLLIKYT